MTDATLTESWEAPWRSLDDYLGADAGLLNVLIMLSTVPEVLAVYHRLGNPAALYRDTIGDLRLWMETDYYYQRCAPPCWMTVRFTNYVPLPPISPLSIRLRTTSVLKLKAAHPLR